MELSPILVEQLIFGAETQRRRTQDSPVLPDVWAYFATPSAEPGRRPLLGPPPKTPGRSKAVPLDLLLTPHRSASPARLAAEVRERLSVARKGKKGRLPARIGYNKVHVVARLYFEEVVQVLLPLTQWWHGFVRRLEEERGRRTAYEADQEELRDRLSPIPAARFKHVLTPSEDDLEAPEKKNDSLRLSDLLHRFDIKELVTALEDWTRFQAPDYYPVGEVLPSDRWEEGDFHMETAFLWMVRMIGAIEWARNLPKKAAKDQGLDLDDKGRLKYLPLIRQKVRLREKDAEVEEFWQIDYQTLVKAARSLLDSPLPAFAGPDPSLQLVNRNRKAFRAVRESRRAIKADAATHLFGISCRDLTWAVIDSGIDAKHPAFLTATEDDTPWQRRTRIERTYDFTRIRPLLDQEVVRELLNTDDVLNQSFGEPHLDKQLDPIRTLIFWEDKVDETRKEGGAGRRDPSRGRLRSQLQDLSSRLQHGREIDWELLDPLLRVDYADPYLRPLSSHGTHVAGILAADWKEEEMQGVCPDMRLWDLRVLDPNGPNDEFTVLAALQFIQYINERSEGLTLQGANLSLSIRHEVTNYACGRTPVCEECERLVSSGVVVVAAAGNAGWDDELARVAAGAGYRTVSITDPGNAEAVITVGATHRNRPHSYGVSFFSSRGPTGDGRAKPDLVAPGEKITSTVPGRSGLQLEDGTSMAAPHVSGAAALLMSRHRELIGRPHRIKEILCATATDLGRERQFQGAGMLDVLRAIQSV